MEYPKMKKIDYGSNEYEKTIDLRNKYFRKPQGLDIRNEDLSGDKEVEMYAGYLNEELMSTIFLSHVDKETAQIKAVIVEEEYRGKKFGDYLMNFIEEKIVNRGHKKIILQARVSVEEFYKKHGYKRTTEPFDYNTIPHIWMEKYI